MHLTFEDLLYCTPACPLPGVGTKDVSLLVTTGEGVLLARV